MRNNYRIIFGTLFMTIAVAITSISSCLAWFESNKNNTETDISGAVLESYFDKTATYSGDPGTETNPYVITTVRHYENLVKLYTQKFYNPVTKQYEYFSDKDYYFEIGKLLDNSGVYKVYEFDDYGARTGNFTTTLNLKGLGTVEPIGNDAHPFNSKINGHGISVENFTVSSGANTNEQWYNDIGIFGYVKTNAYCHDCYWNNFIIDATKAVATSHTDAEAAKHDQNFRIGYLAGHIKTYESFVDCYVNNCSIKSPANGNKQQDDYGYFGMVEKDKTGSGLPEGKNYSYSFDSEKIHNYFNTNYSAIKDQQLTLRNTKEGAGYPDNKVDIPGEKLSSGVVRGDTGDLFNSYYLQGKTVSNSSYSGKDFSLSTIGYVSGQREVKEHDYVTKINIDGEYYNTEASATLSEKSVNENFNEDEQGKYHYYYDKTNKQWDYYFCDNHITKSGDTYDILLDFDQGSETAFGNVTVKESRFDLYLDSDTAGHPSISWNGTSTTSGWKVTWKSADRTLTLPIGQHVAALVWVRRFSTWLDSFSYVSCLIGSRSGTTVTMGNLNNDITHDFASGKYKASTYSIDLTTYVTNSTSGSSITLKGQKTFTADIGRQILGNYNASVPLYGQDNVSTIQLKTTDEQDFSNALFFVEGGKLKVRAYVVTISEEGKERHYVADEKEIAETGYKHNCIDIVGGGVGFYYYNLGTTSIKVCRIDSELNNASSSSSTVVKHITSSDIGKKFYAPGRCNQSIVLYIKNVGSAVDEINDYLGKMTFNYYQVAFRTVHPSYKKGASTGDLNYIDFSDIYGDPSSSGIVNTFSNVEFTEEIVKQACYCCLDSDGNILGTFNKDGSYGTGMTYKQAELIDTYVLVIGSFTSASYANWRLWVRDIQFEYKANAGEGGTFGSVGYRSQGDSKITDTIINFNLTNIAAKVQYMIKVVYKENESTYYITIKTNTQLKLIVYNYYPDSYEVYVNNEQMEGKTHTYTIAASSTSYPDFT